MTRTTLRLLAAVALGTLATTSRADDFSSALGPVFQADVPQTLARLSRTPGDVIMHRVCYERSG